MFSMLESLRNRRCWKDFDMRAHVARVVLFDRDSHNMRFLVHAEHENVDFVLVFNK